RGADGEQGEREGLALPGLGERRLGRERGYVAEPLLAPHVVDSVHARITPFRCRCGCRPCGYGVTGGTRAQPSHGPRVELEGTSPPRGERGVEDVPWVERLDPVDEVLLAEPVQGAHGEAARVDLRALLEQRLDLLVPGEVAGEALGADGRVATVPRGQQDSRPIKDDRNVEALPDQTGRGEQVDQRYRALERDRVDEDERLLTWVCLDVLEDLLFGVVQRVDAGLAAR